MTFLRRYSIYLIALGLAGGLLGEGLLLVRAHCVKVESLLLEDFRVLLPLAPDLDEGHRKLVSEKILAMPATAAIRAVSPDDALSELEARDPEIGRSVAILGKSPLPWTLEVRLEGGRLSGFDAWLDAVGALPEVEEVRYKRLELLAALQARFYSLLLALLLSAAGCVPALLASWVIFRAGLRPEEISKALGPFEALAARCASSAMGTAAGMAVVLVFCLPSAAGPMLRAWPPLWQQAALLLAGGLAGLLFESARGEGGGGSSRESVREPVPERRRRESAEICLS